MEFRRIHALPPYAFAEIDALKMAARRAGEDVIDLGFGNPDIPSPQIAVEKLAEAARNPRNHRYSATRGVPRLRLAITDLYQRRFGVELDPETRGVRHHRRQGGLLPPHVGAARPGRHRTGAEPVATRSTSGARSSPAPACTTCGMGPGEDFFANLHAAWEQAWPRPRVVVMSFPHNPTGTCVDLEFMTRMVAVRARPRRCCSSTTSRTPSSASTGTSRRRCCRSPARRTSRSRSTASRRASRWRAGASGSCSATPRSSARSRGSKSYLDYGTFQPIQIASIVAMNEAPDYPREVNAIYLGRRDALVRRPGPHRLGHPEAARARCSCGHRCPSRTRRWAASSSAKMLVQDAKVAVSPGVGFGPGGEGFVRFALVENEQRIGQARARHPQGAHQARLTGPSAS